MAAAGKKRISQYMVNLLKRQDVKPTRPEKWTNDRRGTRQLRNRELMANCKLWYRQTMSTNNLESAKKYQTVAAAYLNKAAVQKPTQIGGRAFRWQQKMNNHIGWLDGKQAVKDSQDTERVSETE